MPEARSFQEGPLVTIGVPVYNGAALLSRTLESLLGQSYRHLEIVISDNASTDETASICATFRERDGRIRYFRQTKNLGAPANWNFVCQQARGNYFKWAAASDLCHPDLVARCVEVLNRRPEVVLCFGRTCFIDEGDRVSERYMGDFELTEERPSERFRRVCHELRLNNAQSGLIRLEALRRTHLDRLYPHGDRVLMAELALQGKFVLLDDVLLCRRSHPAHFTGTRSPQAMVEMFHPGAKRPLLFLNTRRHIDFLLSALAAPVPVAERFQAARAALQGFYWDGPGIKSDVADAFGRVAPRRETRG